MTHPAVARPAPTRWRTGDAEIAYTDSGGPGDTLLLMHGGGLADWFTPLADRSPAGDRVIRLVRAGYTGAPPPPGLTVRDHAGHAAALLRELGAAPAHVVAHSSGCAVALQLALDHPGLVRTLSLCEPPLVDALADPGDRELLHAAFGPVIGSAMAATARGDLPGAFAAFMTLVCGPDHHRVMVDALGAGPVEEAIRGSRPLFTDEMPALNAWTVDPDALARLRPPVLLVRGGASPAPVHRLVAHLAGLIPGSTVVTVAGAGHLMPLTAPAELGRVLGDFRRSVATG